MKGYIWNRKENSFIETLWTCYTLWDNFVSLYGNSFRWRCSVRKASQPHLEQSAGLCSVELLRGWKHTNNFTRQETHNASKTMISLRLWKTRGSNLVIMCKCWVMVFSGLVSVPCLKGTMISAMITTTLGFKSFVTATEYFAFYFSFNNF